MKTHTIKFRDTTVLNVTAAQDTGKVRSTQLKVRRGECFSAVTIRAYVEDLIEKCDIACADGSEALGVEYGKFQFVDSDYDTSPGVNE